MTYILKHVRMKNMILSMERRDIILGHLTNVTRYKWTDKAMPYARLLTLIFEHYGVDVKDNQVLASPLIATMLLDLCKTCSSLLIVLVIFHFVS